MGVAISVFRFLEDLKKTRHKHIEIKMRLTHMLRKQMPYPITKGARFMALDWDFILKRSHYVRGFLLFQAGFHGFPWFQVGFSWFQAGYPWFSWFQGMPEYARVCQSM